MATELTPLPPRDAIRALFARGGRLEPSFAWQDVWQDTHASMFTVAKSAGFDILSDIFAALAEALSKGNTFRDFAAELTPVLQGKGWWGQQPAFDPISGETRWSQLGSVRRLQTIFDVNMRVSYATGHWASFERNKAVRPLLRYVHLENQENPRLLHHLWHNTVLPVDHPWWNTHACPNGWNCHCTLQSLSERDVARLQREGEKLKFDPPADEMVGYVNKRTGQTIHVPKGIDPGWAYNPGKAGFSQIEAELDRKMASGLFGALPRQWPKPPTTEAEVLRLADELVKGQAEWERGLATYEREAIDTYKGDGAKVANAVLRDDEAVLEDLDGDEVEAAEAVISDLRSALGKARLPASITTFRGVPQHIADRYAHVKAGDVISDPGFFSSSLWEDVAGKFGDFVVETRLQKGAPAMAFVHYIPDVNHVEYEVLLNAGTRMRVVQVLEDRLVVEILAE